MPSLKIRLKLNEGRVGIPLQKLGNIAHETELFLEMLGEDVGLEPEGWIAANFGNGSVMFDCLHVAADDVIFERGRRGLEAVFTGTDLAHAPFVRPATRLQFSAIARQIDPDEVIRFGIVSEDAPEPKQWYDLTRSVAVEIESTHLKVATYHGEIQGIVHAFYKETRTPYLIVRELSTRNLVRCYFEKVMYESAVETLSEPEGVVFVEGEVSEDTVTGSVATIRVSDFRLAPPFDLSFHLASLGTRPDLTGEIEAEDYLGKLDGDESSE